MTQFCIFIPAFGRLHLPVTPIKARAAVAADASRCAAPTSAAKCGHFQSLRRSGAFIYQQLC